MEEGYITLFTVLVHSSQLGFGMFQKSLGVLGATFIRVEFLRGAVIGKPVVGSHLDF
jgi:hypothetical protein